ncbi:hypothetical protein [Microbacterium paraoxydans]|uniref:Uncharacterized protein n=1 Tax=Microbacterium paraoxydans TaxID=199592 RepID=A0ABS5IIL2_9MICO|nr:hypothetical protein [Microbacterium paraoxydans]MBS0022808.1 hypothetical protein [Microbacterium paraoxydans]
MTTEEPPARGVMSRRTMIHAAWVTPVIAFSTATPAAAASLGTPELALNAFALDQDYAWGTVTFSRSGAGDLTQPFDFQGDTGAGWEAIYTGQSTNSSGYFASTLPRVVIAAYSQIRAVAVVSGYGTVTSAPVALADIWA